MKKKCILLYVLFIAMSASSQDLITFKNGDTLNCKITRTDSLSVYYRFTKNNKAIDSYLGKSELRSYQLGNNDGVFHDSVSTTNIKSQHTVVLDSTVYVKKVTKWVNLVTYMQRYGVNANGWSLQYYGYILKSDSKWILPCTFGIEEFTMKQGYFDNLNYQTARINYYMIGISPLRRLNDNFYIKVGCQLLIGCEQLVDFDNATKNNSIVGIAPFQGLVYVPKSNFGLVIGLGFNEKLLSSKVYKSDFGLALELGLKF